MGALQKLDTWSQRVLAANGLWSLIPAGAVAVITQRLASTTEYLAFLGPFGWWMIALLCALVTYLALSGGGLWLETRKLKKTQREIAEKSASPDLINPLAERFYQQRIALRDLQTPMGEPLETRRFDECELIGPATIVLLRSEIAHSKLIDVHFAKVKADAIFDEQKQLLHLTRSRLTMLDCAIRHSKVYGVLFLVLEAQAEEFEKGMGGGIQWMN